MGAIERWNNGEYAPTSSRRKKKFSNRLGKQCIYTRRRQPQQSLEVKKIKGTYVEVSKAGPGTRWGESGGHTTATLLDQEYYLKLERLARETRARRQGPRVECHCHTPH